MAPRRALLVAPLYDGKWLPALIGRQPFVDELTPLLRKRGGYEVKTLSQIVKHKDLRKELAEFFDTDGEVLFYFYGHGCIRPPGVGVLATSDGEYNDEGVLMSEVTQWAARSRAREAIFILDCCHAGAAFPLTNAELDGDSGIFSVRPGRALLAACASHQLGWESASTSERALGAFSHHVVRGLKGAAPITSDGTVRASALGHYVTEAFHTWKQTTQASHFETGDHRCVIVSGLVRKKQKRKIDAENKPRMFGVPFRPSTVFIGRSAELSILESMLVDKGMPVAISTAVEGLGGIGKTELALQLLSLPSIQAAFGNVVWLDGSGPIVPQWEFVARELGIDAPPTSISMLLSQLTRKLNSRGPTLLVLDNASDWSSADKFIPRDMSLLVTTRSHDFGGTVFRHAEIGVLAPDSASELLEKLAPGSKGKSAFPQLVELLGGHALALEIAGYHIRDMCSVDEYVRRLIAHQAEFSKRHVEKTRYHETIESCLDITWASLKSESSRTLWRKAALFAPTSAHRDLLKVSFSSRGTRALDDYTDSVRYEETYSRSEVDSRIRAISGEADEFEEAYAELRSAHILSRVEGHNGERWAMHRLVREFGKARLRSGEIALHTAVLSEWLARPTLPVGPEVPHFIEAVLSSARAGLSFQTVRSRRVFQRLTSNLGSSDIRHIIGFISDELRNPRALTIILDGLADDNDDVRLASLRLLEEVGPIPEIIESLTLALSDRSDDIRSAAIKLISQHGSPQIIKSLDQIVTGTDSLGRLAALKALSLTELNVTPSLRKALESDDCDVQREAALLLLERGDALGQFILVNDVEKMSDEQWVRYMKALPRDTIQASHVSPGRRHLLGKLDIETIKSVAKSGPEEVRTYAATLLLERGDNSGINRILGSLDELTDDAWVRLVDMLAERDQLPYFNLDPDRAFRHMPKLKVKVAFVAMQVPNFDLQLSAAKKLRHDASLEGHEAILRFADGLSPPKWAEVIAALIPIKSGRPFPIVSAKNMQLLADDALLEIFRKSADEPIRLEAATLLCERRNSVGFQVVAKAVSATSCEDRARYQRALENVGGGQSATELSRDLRDPSWKVRQAAAVALGELRKREYVLILSETLAGDADSDVRSACIFALKTIGGAIAKEAVAQSVSADSSERIRESAATALKNWSNSE